MVVTETVRTFRAAGASIAKRADKLGDELPKVRRAGNLAVGAAFSAAVSTNLGGKSVFLRGVGKAGAKVSVRVAPVGDAVVGSMTGPAHLIERDTPRHLVGTGATGDNNGFAMHMPDGRWATGPFMAGGSTGRHPFERGFNEVEPAAPKIYDKGVRVAAVKAGFG